MRVILIHGYNSSPDENFHPWLADELRSRGFEVLIPRLPLVEEPNVLECIQAVVTAAGRLDDQTIILGHSLGGVLALRYLEVAEAVSTPRAVILVGVPWFIRNEKVKTFFLSEFDFEVVMWKAKEFAVIHSHDDQIVPFDHAQKYAKMLGAELIAADGDDHYIGQRYPILLETVLKKAEALPEITPGQFLADDFGK